MAKTVSLNQNKDFRRLYGRGRSNAHPALVTYMLKNREGHCRVGITTSKKIGCAVRRNRARRVIRAAFSQLENNICGSWDIVFVARFRTAPLRSTDIQRIMEAQLRSLGALR